MNLSIIVPIRNEAAGIRLCLEKILEACPDAEVLVVDGGTDDSASQVREISLRQPRVRYLPNRGDRGKGHAIRMGIRASRGALIVQFDADLQFEPTEIALLVAPLEQNQADLVLGSRFLPGSLRAPGSAPVVRSFGNHFMSAYASLICGYRFTDVMAGMKAWRREVTDSFVLSSDGYSYEVELAIKARRNGWRVKDVPVSFRPRTTGVSSVNVVTAGLSLLGDIARFRLERLT